jgi:hypothetical protein
VKSIPTPIAAANTLPGLLARAARGELAAVGARAALALLVCVARREAGQPVGKVEELAGLMGVSAATARRALRDLRRAGIELRGL